MNKDNVFDDAFKAVRKSAGTSTGTSSSSGAGTRKDDNTFDAAFNAVRQTNTPAQSSRGLGGRPMATVARDGEQTSKVRDLLGIKTYTDYDLDYGKDQTSYIRQLRNEQDKLQSVNNQIRSSAASSDVNTNVFSQAIADNERRMAELSGLISTAERDYNRYLDAGKAYYTQTIPQSTDYSIKSRALQDTNDLKYNYINNVGDLQNSRGWAYDAVDYSDYSYMTDQERGIYNYIYATAGNDNADRYLDTIKQDLSRRRYTAENEQTKAWAQENPLAASLLHVPENFFGGIISGADILGQSLANTVTGRPIDFYSHNQQQSARAQSEIEGVSANLAEKYPYSVAGINVAGMLYQTLMSGIDSWAAASIPGPAGIGGALLATNAATSAMREIKDRGGSDQQALIGGVASGIFEALFESMSIENIKGLQAASNVNSLRDVLREIGKSVLTNASEEFNTEVANVLFDAFVLGDASDWQTRVNDYISQGMTESEAKKTVALEMVGQVVESAISGGLMGAGFAGVSMPRAISNTAARNGVTTPRAAYGLAGYVSQETPAAENATQPASNMQDNAAAATTQRDQQNTARMEELLTRPAQRADGRTVLPTAEDLDRQRRAANARTETERTGILAGATDEDIAIAEAISKATGREILFINQAPTENGVVNGYYLDGKIYANTQSKNPVAQIIAHELTHSVEEAGSYDRLVQLVEQGLQRQGRNIEQARQEKQAFYAKNNVMLQDQSAIDAEIVAEYLEQNLFSDNRAVSAAEIQALVNTDRTLAQRILDFIDRILSAIRGKDARQENLIKRVRQTFAQALSETRSAESADVYAGQSFQDAIANDSRFAALKQDLDNGTINEDQYNEYFDMIVDEDPYLRGLMDSEAINEAGQFSISPMVGEKDDYGLGVILDTNLFEGMNRAERQAELERFVNDYLAGNPVVTYDEHGNAELVYFAKKDDMVLKDGAKKPFRALEKFTDVFTNNKLRQISIVQIDELMEVAKHKDYNSDNKHGWLDKNGWEHKTVYVQNKNGNIYKVFIDIADGDGGKILYNISNPLREDTAIKKEPRPEQSASARDGYLAAMDSIDNIAENSPDVKQFSISPAMEQEYAQAAAAGDTKTEERLVEVAARAAGYTTPKLYHGTEAFGFTEFDMDLGEGLIFATDEIDIAGSYVENGEPKRIVDRLDKDIELLAGEELLEEAAKVAPWARNYEYFNNDKRQALLDETRKSIRQTIEIVDRITNMISDANVKRKCLNIKRALNNMAHANGLLEFRAIRNYYEFYKGQLYGDQTNMTAHIDIVLSDANKYINQLRRAYDDDTFVRKEGAPGRQYRDAEEFRDAIREAYENGIYELYGKPGNQLVIDGDYNNWNRIVPPAEFEAPTGATLTTREIAEGAKELGYDSVLIKDLYDYGGRNDYYGSGNIYIFFDPSQVKSADPEVYDDNGQLIPLGERFNSDRNDIRLSISPIQDDEYMQAVSAGDTAAQQRLIDETADRVFADSKVRDRRTGKLRYVYHYTDNTFNEFQRMDASKHSNRTKGDGYYVSTSEDEFKSFGKNKMKLYANIVNPFEMELTEQQAQEVYDKYFRPLHSDRFHTYEPHVLSKLQSTFGVFDYLKEAAETNDTTTSAILSELGFDGVHDGSEWVAFESSQLKSADPVTYDDDGNVIPRRERFNEKKPDVRFSISSNTQEREAVPATISDNGEILTEELRGGTIAKYSITSWNDTDKDKVRQNLVSAGFTRQEADNYIDQVNGIAAIIAGDPERLDYNAATNQVYMKPNSEYVVTLDASTLCAKRLPYQGTIDKIMHILGNRVLMPEDLIQLSNMMAEAGYTTPCGICYVESRRRHLSKMANEWLQNYKGDYKPTLDEVTSSDGLENLRKTHNATYQAFVKAMNRKGSANPKVVQLRTDYRQDINRLTKTQIEKILRIGGIRVQSFSDFETPHLIDMMQAVLDMSGKKLTSQAYTKVPNFAWVFGDTGIKINLSLIGDIDENGNLTFSPVEGMDIEEAMRLRDRYSKNVGTILVGKNDAHILAAMADDRIDFIIPFHKSGWSQSELNAMKSLIGYDDYTEYQNERIPKGKNKRGKYITSEVEEGNYYPVDYWDYDLTGKENAEKYLAMCAEDGRLPKFWNFLVDNGDGSFSLQPDGSTDGYWKLLIDYKMYDNDGNGAPQTAVTPTFNMEEAERVLSEYEGGANELPSASDEFINQYIEWYESQHGSTQYSISPAQDAEYMQAVAVNDTAAEQQLVDDAANIALRDSKIRDANGKLITLYHGTEADFNVFDPKGHGGKNGTAEGFGIYLTNEPEVSTSYGDRQLKLYADIKRPAYSDRVTIKQSELTKLIEATCKQDARNMVAAGDYDNVNDALKDTWVSNYVYTYGYPSMSRVYSDVAKSIMQMNDNDVDIVQEVMMGMGIRSYNRAMEFYNEVLTPTIGIDGLWQSWENTHIDVILAFDSSQIKSAEPVTYDDAGNVIPLSDRFNTDQGDIRYSISRNIDPEEKQRMVSQLRRYINGEISREDVLRTSGSPAFDSAMVDVASEPDYITLSASDDAREIINAAREMDMSVDEYIRANWDYYEVDGGLSEAAREALQVEQRAGRTSTRYSISDNTSEDQVDESQVNRLPAKAADYVKRVERNFTEELSKLLSIPKSQRRDYLNRIVRDLSNEYLRTGKISDETRTRAFNEAYDRGVMVESDFYNQYKNVKDMLRKTAISISEYDRHDIADFNDFRKRAFGALRIVNEGGLPVDVFYQELQQNYPELFPEEITAPSDQIRHMYEVAKFIEKTELSLDQYYGRDAEEFRTYTKYDFDKLLDNLIGELRYTQQYVDERTRRSTEPPVTLDEVQEAYTNLKDARRVYERARARTLLTTEDNNKVNRLLLGELTMDDITTGNIQGIRSVYEAKADYEDYLQAIRQYNAHRKQELREKADILLKDIDRFSDKKMGILYARETMERNIRDIAPDSKTAEALIDEYIKPVHKAQAEATKGKNKYRDRVRALGLSRKVAKGNLISEAHAVQLLGEAYDNIRVIQESKGRITERDGKSQAEWNAVIAAVKQENPNMDMKKIDKAIEEFRKIYDELYKQMNDVRIANGYEPINYRQGYFPHFQPGEEGILAQFARAIGMTGDVTELPTTIAGLTHEFRPGIQWFSNAQQRLGFNTAYDALEGFDKYIEGCMDIIHQTENIQKLRALAAQIRYNASDEGIRKQIDDIRAMDLLEEDKQNRIDAIHSQGRYAMSGFVQELDEYTNLLANKKSKYDRGMEQLIGRGRLYNFGKALNRRLGANMVAINPGSWLTNYIPLSQGWAELGTTDLLKGMADTLKSYHTDDGIVQKSTFLTNRKGSDTIVKTWREAIPEAISFMENIDQFTAGSLIRAKYQQNLAKGMSETLAMEDADDWVAGVMADRSKGSMPTIFASHNPIVKLFTQFQLEVNNQISYLLKDVPRRTKEKGAAVLAAALMKFLVGAFLFNELYEYLVGRRAALDPIGILNDTVGDLTGYELPNLIELGVGAVTGNMPTFEVGKTSKKQAAANLGKNIAEELPFVGGLIGGGRLPISSALPNIGKVATALDRDSDIATNKRLSMLGNELAKPALYLIPPFGGGQAKKLLEGVKAVKEGGSYSLNNQGEELLQYPVFSGNPLELITNYARASVFGKSSLPEARKWVESDFDSLSRKETAAYQGMVDAGEDPREAYDFVRQLSTAEKTDGKSKQTVQLNMLENANLTSDAKGAAYYAMFATDEEAALMESLESKGADPGETASVLMDIHDINKSSLTDKTAAKADVIASSNLTTSEKIEIYANTLGKSSDKTQSRYDRLIDKGLSDQAAYNVSIELDLLKPVDGRKSVTDLQRYAAIVGTGISDRDQYIAFGDIMDDATYGKVTLCYNYGITPRSYTQVKILAQTVDDNNNLSQAEAKAAINQMSWLSNSEKAVLWQVQNKSWKGSKNPYNRGIGAEVYAYLQQIGTTTAQPTYSYSAQSITDMARSSGIMLPTSGNMLPAS